MGLRLGWVVNMRTTTVIWVLTCMVLVGCRHENNVPTPGRSDNAPPMEQSKITAQRSEIIKIAKDEAVRRDGWSGNLEVDVQDTKKGWEARVWRMPKTPGGFVDIVITPDKRIVSYRHGR
jgi:hypothetical protein